MRGVWISILFLATITIQLSWFMYYFFVPSVDNIHAEVRTPLVKFGDNVIVKYTYTRNMWCEVIADRFIINIDTNTLVRRERLPSGALPLGTGSLNVLIPTKIPTNSIIPFGIADPSTKDLIPGKYVLREISHNKCGMRAPVTIPITDSTFEVVE